MRRPALPVALLLQLLVLAPACGVHGRTPLRLGVTTTTRDSGLLDALLPAFEAETGIRVDPVAAPTLKALALAEAGDVDVVWVHHRALELEFLAAGHAVRHEPVMYGEFVIVGPADDPAGIAGLDPVAALRRVAERRAPFVSRGDQSGTHLRELALWEEGGGLVPWEGYLESASGMGPSLVMADQVGAYALADRGTFLRFRKRVELVELVREPGSLRNEYGILVVSPDKGPWIRHEEAERFVDWLVGEEGRSRIEAFRVDGEVLFHPEERPAAAR